MNDKIQLKVYTFWKENEKPEIRRLVLEKMFFTRFCHLNLMIQDVFPDLKTKTYSVAWRDEDGEDIVVSSDVEMSTALHALKGDVVKFFVYCKTEKDKDTHVNSAGNTIRLAAPSAIHHGVICDVCGSTVVGFRYNCIYCDNYDLCSACEAAGHHQEHITVRLPTPEAKRTLLAELATARGSSVPPRGVFSSSKSIAVALAMPALNMQLAYRDDKYNMNL